MTADVDRDLEAIRLPKWGRVAAADGVVPWLVVDDDGVVVEPVLVFLRDFVARGNRPGSVRSYAFGLLRWWRWLRAVGVDWTGRPRPRSATWCCGCSGQRSRGRRRGRDRSPLRERSTRLTGKRHLDDLYAPRTVRHSNAVVGSFYEFWIEAGSAPLVNPVSRRRVNGRRSSAGHNPMQPFRAEGKLRYNPKLPRQRPRTLNDDQWLNLFGVLRSHRDRALLALAVSNGARPSKLLGLRGCDLNWGEQLIRVEPAAHIGPVLHGPGCAVASR